MLEKTITFDRFVRGMLIALLIGAILVVTNYLSNVLLPFFIAWLLAYLLYPMVKFVQYRLHVPGRALSIIVTLLVVIGVITGIIYLIIPPMIEQFEKLGELVTRYLHQTTHIKNFPLTIRQWIDNNGEEIQQFFKKKEVTDTIRKLMPRLFEVITQTATVIISIITSMVTLIYLFFILLDYETLSAGFLRMFPPKSRPFWRSLKEDVETQLDSYVRGQSLVALCIGILFCIGFTIIGFPMAIGLGILIGLLSLVPYLHGFAFIPMVLLSALKAVDTGENFWIIFGSAVLVFIIVQAITDMVLTPKIMGKAMGLNPAILLLSLSVWGALLGFIGLIIALPLTTLLIAYYKRYVVKELPIDVEKQSENEYDTDKTTAKSEKSTSE